MGVVTMGHGRWIFVRRCGFSISRCYGDLHLIGRLVLGRGRSETGGG